MVPNTSQIAANFLKKLSKPREMVDPSLDAVKSRLRGLYGEKTYNSWFKDIELVENGGNTIVLSVPTLFIKEWILTYYIDDILSTWGKENNEVVSISIEVRSSKGKVSSGNGKSNIIHCVSDNSQEEAALNCSSPLDPKLTFDSFVVGKSNEFAFAAAKNVAQGKNPITGSNPLFLYGGVGLGKTHLMHAIAWHIKESSSNRTVAYLSAEKFMYQYITALREKSIMDFKLKFRSLDVLMIDDVQFISGKNSTQEEFFHTFNTLIDHQKQLVISADRSPCELEGVEERIKSRLNWGLVADIHNSTFELRVGILQKKAHQLRTNVPADVLEFLAAKITSNIRELEGALHKIIAHASLTNTKINLETVKYILRDLLRANQHTLDIPVIQQKVAKHFDIKMSDMLSKQRTRNVLYPRQIAMYICKKLTSKSLPEIGRSFHGKDHSTVIHAIRKVEENMVTDAKLAHDVTNIIQILS